jgi:hypothetical protein
MDGGRRKSGHGRKLANTGISGFGDGINGLEGF